jgi:hypothetical protein
MEHTIRMMIDVRFGITGQSAGFHWATGYDAEPIVPTATEAVDHEQPLTGCIPAGHPSNPAFHPLPSS